jgi:dolichol-phosphate mannosyltransferase
MKLLSIVIPAYNEAAYIGNLLGKIAQVDTNALGFEKEVLVVNDGSSDATESIARSFESSGVKCFTQVPNQGKGRAVQRGIREAAGDYILVQDADLEYDPADYLPMLRALETGADSIYGSRVLGQISKSGWTGRHPAQGLGPWMAGVILSVWTFLLYGRWISDTLTAYKLYPARELKAMKLETSGFETDHEITAKLIRGGLKIVEVPISYNPRSADEGKNQTQRRIHRCVDTIEIPLWKSEDWGRSCTLKALPTVLRSGPYRFFFYSADGDEPPHVHVEREESEAKFWLDPVRLERSRGFVRTELRRIEGLVGEKRNVVGEGMA